MSAIIYYEKTKISDKYLKFGWPSDFMKSMADAGMEDPCELGHSHYDKLNAMASVCTDKDNPYRQICDLIIKLDDNETIRLWAEY